MIAPSRWSITERVGFGFLLVLMCLAALVVLIGIRLSDNEKASAAVDAAMAQMQRVDQLERSLLLLAVSTREILLQRTPQAAERFAASEARVNEAVRALEREDQGTAGRTPTPQLLALVSDYLRAVQRAVAEGPSQVAELATARDTVLLQAQQMLREQEGGVRTSLLRMQSNRRAAATALTAGAAITGLLFVLIALVTVRSIRRPARELVAVASSLSSGDWQPALRMRAGTDPARSTRFEMAQIADAFGAAAGALELREQRLFAHGELARVAGASLDRACISEAALHSVLKHVGAEVGAIYWLDRGTGHLVPVAGRAAGLSLAPVAPGEGIVGQCARDGQTLVVGDIPADTPFRVKLGYDEAPPRTVAAIPIQLRKETLGVLLVASLRELDPGALAFLASASAQIGIGLMNARAYEEVQELLAAVRAQGSEIQAQNEELQAQGEEIQAQNEELQRQRSDLMGQAAALRDANERKNEFLGVLAHELRNPLTPIGNCVGLLTRQDISPAVFSECREILARQVRHMTRLIDDLLDATRISRGKLRLDRERINLIELVHECLDDQRASLEQHGIALVLALPEFPIHVQGDHTRLCQVFSNLLINAVKFCGRGSNIEVTVSLDAPGREVAVHVCDDGIGIEADFLSTIFEPFTQAENELARTKGGLGLGLALAKTRVELHGGRIAARSDGLGQGAAFLVTLPLAEVHGNADESGPGSPAVLAETASAAKRVLVIDDNADAAYSLGQLLSLEGFEVEVAYGAHAGLEAGLRFRPDAILCDIGLPGMDGYEFSRQARRQAVLRTTLLVALTGYSSPDDQARATEAGFDLHMAKPPALAQLLELLRASTGQRRTKEAG